MTFEKMTKNGVCYKKKDDPTLTVKKAFNKEAYQRVAAKLKGKEGRYFTAIWVNGEISDVEVPENNYNGGYKGGFKGGFKGKSSGNYDTQCAVKTAGNALSGIDGVSVKNYEEIFKNLIKVGLENIIKKNNKPTESTESAEDWSEGTQETNLGAGTEENYAEGE